MFNELGIISSNPHDIAVIDNGNKYTYEEFVEMVKKFSCHFIKNNISRVLINLPQSVAGYSLIWAAYLSGTTFCPLQFEIPRERKKYIADNFKAQLILSEDTFCNNILTKQPNEILINDLPIEFDILNIKPLTKCAYVIFTSGSTGLPKGVIINRQSLNNFLTWSCSEYKLSKNDRWAQYSSLGFDLSICDVFTTLSQGATLVSFSTKAHKLFPAKFIQSERITCWHSVPGVIDLMVHSRLFKSKSLNSLRFMSFCGETLYTHYIEKLFSINPNLTIYNNYGPTEGTIYCTSQKINKDNYSNFCLSSVSIGTPIPGYNILLEKDSLGDHEIVLLGDFIGDGYLNTVNSQGFKKIKHNNKETKSYKTGDYVACKNENIFFLKRKDSQVKINGIRVDLNEIDRVLRFEFPSSPCITIYRDKKILTFIKANNSLFDKAYDVIKKHLPFHFLPHKIIKVKKIPYNINQKIDTESLYLIFQNSKKMLNERFRD